VPIPGAEVRATQGDKVERAITDTEGNYSIADGTWILQVEMLGFEPIRAEVVVTRTGSGIVPPIWDLKLLPVGEIHADAAPGFLSTSPALRLSRSRPASTVNPDARRNLAPIQSPAAGDSSLLLLRTIACGISQ
jgi:hypothetical protein